MVNIRSLISKKREEFRNFKTSIEKSRLESERKRLEQERIRQGELAKVAAERQKVKRDVERLQAYNQKNKSPSRLQRLAKGMAKTINQAKERNKLQSLSDGQRPGALNFGGRGFDGQSVRDPFSPQAKREPAKKKDIKVIIKQ